ncbi:chloroplastic group IIA intron splicing facilitator CRS1, chloroplastic [Prosopis cineraria]|uniref:chloroplastic group IIA intron splicing facilitator CRS1, chloroplastic n=1 Tax=Prosopis cineraria TaxID=364024 RepID=UPI002410917B|nr:chloroplastic group IIA intron splicing facilitator CRS1, chloroplastic [Prosopis cineraria]XP_054788027.1 chloroplastic group IIA intron splicing facilitator CRS1, chloroplastic [Prosopis cineraria]XP_054788028.1 chloroplastic group IIA intron splicing facilitator CRS1, chloroplastic [Prosopis cineraria]XP_054788029.1 chloroplastic group IIA intron splicing facilitator CRS1, chloroplastic [Prosopis cineraria]XP_054788030.1 chloroplastic group IIA intron splicing facilitator CRS1, chloroplas
MAKCDKLRNWMRQPDSHILLQFRARSRQRTHISLMPAMIFLSLLPQLSGNPNIAFHSISFPYSFSNTSSFSPQNPPKNPIQNHPFNLFPIASTTNPNSPISSESKSHPDAPVKAPTPPWMKGPLLIQPHEVLNLSKPNANKRFNKSEVEQSDKALTAKESGVRGKKAMKKIVQSIEKLRKGQNYSTDEQMDSAEAGIGDTLERLEKDGDSRTWSRMPWEKDERIEFRRTKKEKAVTTADLTLDKTLLRRLRSEAARMRTWVKVKKAGVTQAVVDEIKRIWTRSELAMVKFCVPLCRNMDRAQEIVELKTGGLVVWSKKDILVIYRGHNHQITPKLSEKIYTRYFDCQNNLHGINFLQSETKDKVYQFRFHQSSAHDMLSWKADSGDSTAVDIHSEDVNGQLVTGSLFERETDRLLDGLGPRFIDWWMHKPLPVDGDLLPEVVPGFEPPFRLSPPCANSKMTDNELTYLRNLAHPLPVHFVLGRNKGLQGLASAILKLWEKSLVAKIAVKYGVPNTDNEKMANELKFLTGGTLLLRNKFYIILYRGKDFLPRNVAALVEKREEELKGCQLHEEVSRLKAVEAFSPIDEPQQHISTSGTLLEFKKIQRTIWDAKNIHVDSNVQLEAEIVRLERELKKGERQLSILNKKLEISTKELSKLNAAWTPSDKDADLEIMTEEERQCFQKIGLQMRSCLVLGRRGIFDGVVEGIHQHWKHREVVKIITKQRVFGQVMNTATSLEAGSGGVLVSVDKLKEGHAIIIYRGKNYRRPLEGLTKNLLTKREALRRSTEMQRIGSLKFFAHQRQRRIADLKLKMADLQQRKEVEQRDRES